MACVMTFGWPTEIPLPSGPPHVELPYLAERKYPDLSIVSFPCLEDDVEPVNTKINVYLIF